MFDINGWEIILLLVLCVVILGPERLPQYAAKFARAIKQARVYAAGAKAQLKEQMGPEFDDIDWRAYDPRQYDPRRIVREALAEPLESIESTRAELSKPLSQVDLQKLGAGSSAGAAVSSRVHDPSRPTPWDVDAT